MVSSRCEVFVSYRSSQRPIAAALDEALRSRGYSTFFDRRNIGDFDSVDATLESALRGALLVLSVFSADYLESMPCNAELLFALNAHNGAQVAGDASAGRSRLRIANPESDKHHLVDMPLAGHTVNVAPLTDKTDAVAVELWANIVAAELAPHIEQLRAAGSQPLSLYFSLTGTLELGMNELRTAQTAQALFATADPQQHLQHALLGRDRQALSAHQQLHGSVGNSILHPANLPGSLVVHGLPGVGKTSFGQLLARRFHWSYPGGVFAFDAVGYPLDVASRGGVNTAMAPQDTQYEALKRMLIRFTSISSDAHQAVTAQVGDLSIFDRVEGRGRLRPAMTAAWSTLEGPYLWWVDDPPPNTGADYFRQWQPPTEKGLFLVTQRDLPPDAWAANVMALDCLKVGAARTLLTRNTPPQGPNEVQAAAAILTALDGHPLGLHAAANQIRRQKRRAPASTPYALLAGALSSSHDTRALDASPSKRQAHALISVQAVIGASIESLSDNAKWLLLCVAALPSAPAWTVWLKQALDENDATRTQSAVDELIDAGLAAAVALPGHAVADAAVDALGAHALVMRAAIGVNVATAHEANAAMLRAMARHCATAMDDHDIKQPPSLAQHIAFVAFSMEQDTFILPPSLPLTDALRALAQCGLFLLRTAAMAETREVLRTLLNARRRVLGEEHPDTLTSMANLGAALQAQGDLPGARVLVEQALAVRRRVLGEEHPETLGSMNNLASTLRELGDLAEAQMLEERALALNRRVLGEEHPNTLTSLNNLALTRGLRGDLLGARVLQEQALTLSRRVRGAGHPETLTCAHNLAGILLQQGDLAGARVLQEQALAGRLRVLGEAHHITLTSMNGLALLLELQRDLPGARLLGERILAVRRRVLGEEHPDTLTSMNNLAGTLKALGDLPGARSLCESALAGRRVVLGEQHPHTLGSMNNLAGTLEAQGDLPAARELQEQALALSLRVLGEEHPDTLNCMNNLAGMLKAGGDLPGARLLHEQALAGRCRVLGAEHSDTLTSVSNLGSTLYAQGDLPGARLHQEQALAGRRQVLGEEHPNTLITMNNLAATLWAHGDLPAARSLFAKCHSVQQGTLGETHPSTLAVAKLLRALNNVDLRANHQQADGADSRKRRTS